MSTQEDNQSMQFKKFVSQDEIDDQRKKRQEEWEKVRKPDQPLEAPEEVYDSRSLYDRLQEQKQKQQDDHDEQFQLKNQVKGLEDEEVKFIDFVSDRQAQLLKERQQEEDGVLSEYRNSVLLKANEVSLLETKTASSKKPTKSSANKKSQLQLLAGAVKRKSTETVTSTGKKQKSQESDDNTSTLTMISGSDENISENIDNKCNNETLNPSDKMSLISEGSKETSINEKDSNYPGGRQVVAVLPGLGVYGDSDSDNSSDSSSSPFSDDNAAIPMVNAHHTHGGSEPCNHCH